MRFSRLRRSPALHLPAEPAPVIPPKAARHLPAQPAPVIPRRGLPPAPRPVDERTTGHQDKRSCPARRRDRGRAIRPPRPPKASGARPVVLSSFRPVVERAGLRGKPPPRSGRAMQSTKSTLSGFRGFGISPRVVGARRCRACPGLRENPACGGGRRRTKPRGENPQKAARTRPRRKPGIPAPGPERSGVPTPGRRSCRYSANHSWAGTTRMAQPSSRAKSRCRSVTIVPSRRPNRRRAPRRPAISRSRFSGASS